MRDEFISSATHDLKTPLTAIKGQTQLAQRRVANAESAEAHRILEGLQRIDVTATKMVRLIDEMLDVARLQMGRSLELDRQPIELVSLV